ncbi:hypothetical protein ABZ572_38285 [Streptomyces sp. NPDC018338]|uniref:hypothetical protein n=1 Tax=Streptomyces sp. NPDC018338 TaxID=3157192 RepID=UPI0033C2C3A2
MAEQQVRRAEREGGVVVGDGVGDRGVEQVRRLLRPVLGEEQLRELDELTERSSFQFVPVTPWSRNTLKRVAASFDQVAPDDERLPLLRHLLAHHMLRSMLYAGALEQFGQIGPWCGAPPWRKDGNPVAAFESARGTAAKLSRARPTSAPQPHGIVR